MNELRNVYFYVEDNNKGRALQKALFERDRTLIWCSGGRTIYDYFGDDGHSLLNISKDGRLSVSDVPYPLTTQVTVTYAQVPTVEYVATLPDLRPRVTIADATYLLEDVQRLIRASSLEPVVNNP